MTLTFSAIAVRTPLKVPTGISTRMITDRHYLLVRVHDSDGDISGFGYTYIGSHGSKSALLIFEEVFLPLLGSVQNEGISDIWESLYAETLLVGRGGIAIRVLSAIDIALWDLRSKQAKAPLSVMLGGGVRPVSAYASGGYYRSGEKPSQAIQEEIELNIKSGFTKHKIKVGGLDISQDADRVAIANDVMPSGHILSLDANNAYSSPSHAAKALSAFEKAAGDRGIWWFEEPLHPNDVAGHKFLRDRFLTPIASGEILQTRHDVLPFIHEQAVDILQLDAGVIGGITEFNKVAHAAGVSGILVAPHWHANLHVCLAPALENCFVIEHFLLEKDIYNFENLLTEESRLQYKDGEVIPRNVPGLGIVFDENKLTEYSVTGNGW